MLLNGNGRKVIGSLTKLGLGEYEARAYFTLLLCGESKAWDIARKSGVPQAVVYKILETLVAKRVVAVKEGRPKRYESAPLKELVESYLESARNGIESAKESERWLEDVEKTFAPLAKKQEARVFEPKYARG